MWHSELCLVHAIELPWRMLQQPAMAHLGSQQLQSGAMQEPQRRYASVWVQLHQLLFIESWNELLTIDNMDPVEMPFSEMT